MGFSFVNEENMPRKANTEVSYEAGGVAKTKKRSSFDGLEIELTQEVTDGQ